MITKTLKEYLTSSNEFIFGAELVTTRGILLESQSKKILNISRELSKWDEIHFLDFTDNPGGHPMLLPESLGSEILFSGKNVMINQTCKDMNRNGLESRAWKLASDGFENILCLSGDYPVGGYQGLAKPVFDIDSVGLISLLNEMNLGMKVKKGKEDIRLKQTQFYIGTVASPFKKYESELMPQYFKLEKKVKNGADFLVTQIGYDSRKLHELVCYMDRAGIHIPKLANVYVLTARIAQVFNEGGIPGVVVSDVLRKLAGENGNSLDKGKSFFYELASKQIAIAKGLGYQGVYLGGIHKMEDYRKLLEISKSYGENDWKEFAKEIQYPVKDTFYLFKKNFDTQLNQKDCLNLEYLASLSPEGKKRGKKKVGLAYKFSRVIHDRVFNKESKGYRFYNKVYGRLESGHPHLERFIYALEKNSKVILYDCRDCGDCSLPDIAYLCPESQCVKNQRNGACGGTRMGLCELENGKRCIWARAYERLKQYGEEKDFINTPVIIKDNSLQGISAWKNTFLGRDHFAKLNYQTGCHVHGTVSESIKNRI